MEAERDQPTRLKQGYLGRVFHTRVIDIGKNDSRFSADGTRQPQVVTAQSRIRWTFAAVMEPGHPVLRGRARCGVGALDLAIDRKVSEI